MQALRQVTLAITQYLMQYIADFTGHQREGHIEKVDICKMSYVKFRKRH